MLDILSRSVVLSDKVKSIKALHYLRFGTARRLQIIWHAYSRLIFTAPPERSEPLNGEESKELTNDLNAIYVNVRGTLDNLCWALLHEYAPEVVANLRPSKIGLFKSCVLKEPRFVSLVEAVSLHLEWDKDLAKRRDPSAHRIPLTVPPQMLSPEEAEQYRKLFDAYFVMRLEDRDKAQATMDQLNGLGKFSPYFLHDPENGVIALYPTVSSDVAHVIELFYVIEEFFLRQIVDAPQNGKPAEV